MATSMEVIRNHNVKTERTYGFFPDAKLIRKRQRMEDINHERRSLSRLVQRLPSSRSERDSVASPCPTGMMEELVPKPRSQTQITRLSLNGDGRPTLQRSRTMPSSAQRPLTRSKMSQSSQPAFQSRGSNSGQSVRTVSTTYIPDHVRYKYEHNFTHFRYSKETRHRHFFIDPEWISEGLLMKRLKRNHISNPMSYGWI